MRHIASSIFLLLPALVFLSSCGWLPVQFESRMASDQTYSLEVPSYLSETTPTDNDLLLQLGDAYRDVYLVLRRDSISALSRSYPEWDVMDFYDFHMENLVQDIQDAVAPGPDSVHIHGNSGLYGMYAGYYKGDPLAFRLALIEAPVYQYQLLMWTRQDQMTEIAPFMDSIVFSFRTFP